MADETEEEKKLREALKREADKVEPKGKLKDIQDKIKGGKGNGKKLAVVSA